MLHLLPVPIKFTFTSNVYLQDHRVWPSQRNSLRRHNLIKGDLLINVSFADCDSDPDGSRTIEQQIVGVLETNLSELAQCSAGQEIFRNHCQR